MSDSTTFAFVIEILCFEILRFAQNDSVVVRMTGGFWPSSL